MRKYALINGIIISGGELLLHKAVVVADGWIAEVADEQDVREVMECHDLGGCYLSPGFIDLQVNGVDEASYSESPTKWCLADMENAQIKEGTTGFLATVPTVEAGKYEQLTRCAASYRARCLGNYLGLHLEGPYINVECKGAHPVAHIKTATADEIGQWCQWANGEIKMMTLAAELQPEGIVDYIERQGIVCSLGHSAATYDEAMDFFGGGKRRMVTHLYDGMKPMHHRNPGLVAAALLERPYTGIITDGVHVSFPMVKLAKRMIGDRLVIVTDRVAASGEGSGRYIRRGDHYVAIGENGEEILAGSALSMLRAVENCVRQVEIPLPEAVNMGTLYPAQVLGLENEVGLVQKGHRANLAVFDKDFQIREVYLNGERKA